MSATSSRRATVEEARICFGERVASIEPRARNGRRAGLTSTHNGHDQEMTQRDPPRLCTARSKYRRHSRRAQVQSDTVIKPPTNGMDTELR